MSAHLPAGGQERMKRRSAEQRAVVDLGIDGYEDAVVIGRGGSGVVYEAWEVAFGRFVAIKVISTTLDSSVADRFARECVAIGTLSGHPNIVTVHGSGLTANGQPYIVMELLDEGSLEDQPRRQPLDWMAAVQIAIKVAGALECAHRAGILHRDVKPGNVLRSRFGDYKLGDFGIARIEGRSQTSPGRIAASWPYAAPEVAEGKPTVVSDVYSLAATLFDLLAGHPPFVQGIDESLLPFISRAATSPVPDLRPSIPDDLATVVERGLAKSPAERPASAADFGRLLQACQRAAGIASTPLPLEIDEAETRLVGDAVRSEPEAVPEPRDASNQAERATPGRSVAAGRTARFSSSTRRAGAVASAVVVVTVLALVGILVRGHFTGDGGNQGDASAGRQGSTATTTDAPSTTQPAPSQPKDSASTGAEVRLGQDLRPIRTEPCRAPSTANGAAWQPRPVLVGSRSFDTGYYCNMFAGGYGSLDFVLGGSYRSLRLTIGFVDGSAPTNHHVAFEFIGDGRDDLIETRTLMFGESQDLEIDVTGVTQLRITLTEKGAAGGSEASSQPVLAAPTLVRA